MWSMVGLQNPSTAGMSWKALPPLYYLLTIGLFHCLEEVSCNEGSRENSQENAGWVNVHPGQPSAAPSSTASAAYNPNNDTGGENSH